MRKIIFQITFLCLIILTFIDSRTKDEWKSRTIYQVLTDRFARTNGDQSDCDLHNYCGGTYTGLLNNLDYIAGMGFDALWISPIIENWDGGYHGYWMKNIYNLNPRFGTEEEFQALVEKCHEKGIWIMVDVVANHMGPVGTNYGQLYPFNKAEHYHDYCIINNEDFSGNQWRVENCRLADLPDLKQENDYVKNTLLSWIQNLVKKYKIDGLRIDTIPEVPKWFWKMFAESSGVFTIGEIFDGRTNYVADYQNYIDATLNYPLYFSIRSVFASQNSMNEFESKFIDINKNFKDPSVLGVFIDNHDNARFLNQQGNQQRFKSALVFSLLVKGIPIVYYGDEQMFAGSNDPYNREPIWKNMDKSAPVYGLIGKTIQLRKTKSIWLSDQVQRYSDNNFYAFTRGDVFAVFTNSNNSITRTITYHPFNENDRLCNYYNMSDCIYVRNKSFDVTLINGEFKVFIRA